MSNPVPENISEEYYQISDTILSSFPKYRPPLDFFVFNNKIGQLVTYSKKGVRLTNEQIDELQELCAAGDLFVSRADHPVYSEHIIKQLDLVLVDNNLKAGEVAQMCMKALELRLEDFFNQPVKPFYEQVYADAMVVTEYLFQDLHRIKLFMRRLHKGEYSLAKHSVNVFCIGMWFIISNKKEDIKRKDFDNYALAFLLHDIGMAKIPSFIINKTTPLKPDEKEKIPPHTLAGYKILQKLDLVSDSIRQAAMEHHERLNGSGYPQRTKDISTVGKITAVADAFSAMIQKRAYAPAKEMLTAAKELSADQNNFDLLFSGQLMAAILNGTITPLAESPTKK